MKYSFGEFEFDASRLELRRDGAPAALERRVTQLLLFLLENSYRTVSKDEIFARIWPDSTVGDSSLTRLVSVARRHLSPDVIENVYGEGYRIGVPVERTDVDQSTGGAAASASAIVGRQHELTTLGEWLESGLQEGLVGIVRGEPGIGKTRLATEFVRSASTLGLRVLDARARTGAGEPYAIWGDLFDRLTEGESTEALRRQYGGSVEDVADVLRSIRARHPELAAPGLLGRESAQARFFLGVAEMLAVAAANRPLLCVIDDLQWIDAASSLLLRDVLERTRSQPIVWLLLTRPAGDDEIDTLGSIRSVRSMDLAGLETSHVAELALQWTGRLRSADVVDALRRRTSGNPQFLRQIVEGVDEGTARSVDSVARDAPTSLAKATRDRLAQLPAPCLTTLEIASVIGTAFRVSTLAEAIEHDEFATLDTLAPAFELGLVLGESNGLVYRFQHETLREEILDGIPIGRRARTHEQVARTLEDNTAHSTAGELSILAWHFARSVTKANLERAIDYGLRAARAEMEALAFVNAIQHYLNVIEIHPAGPIDRLASIWFEVSEAQWAAGEPGSAEESAWRAIEIAQRCDAIALVARAAIAMSEWQMHNTGQVASRRVEVLEQVLDALPAEEVDLRCSALAALASDLHWGEHGDRGRERLASALAPDTQPTDTHTRHRLAAAGFTIWSRPGDFERRSACVADELRWSRELGRTDLEIIGLLRQFSCDVESGHGETVDALLDRARTLAERLRQPRFNNAVDHCLVHRAVYQGRLDEAERLRERADRFAPNRTDDIEMLVPAAQWYAIRRFQNRLPELEPLYRLGVERFPVVHGFRAGLGMMALAAGDTDAAQAACAPLWRGDEIDLAPNMLYSVSLANLAEVTLEIGSIERIRAIYVALAPYRRRVMMLQTVMSQGCGSRLLGRAADRLERFEEAEQHFADALAVERALGARPWEAITLRNRADLFGRLGRADEAAQDIRAAAEIERKIPV